MSRIHKRSDGRWHAKITRGDRRVNLYGKSKSEVETKLARLRLSDPQSAAETKQTVGSLLKDWLQSVKSKVADTTWDRYELSVRNYLLPYSIAALRLDKLRPADVDRLYAEHVERGASSSASKRAGGDLTKALNYAVRMQIILSNPAALVPKPKVERREMLCLTLEEARQFLATAEGNRLHAMFVLAMTVGVRQGELIGLRWSDLDLKNATLSIRRSIRERRGKLTVEKCKTDGSRRTVRLNDAAMLALQEHRGEMLREGKVAPDAWVFPNRKGGLLRKSNLVRQVFKKIRDRAGVPKIRFHDMRHTAASLLLNQGVPITTVGKILGHSDAHTTLRVYAHVMPEQHEVAAQVMSRLFASAG